MGEGKMGGEHERLGRSSWVKNRGEEQGRDSLIEGVAMILTRNLAQGFLSEQFSHDPKYLGVQIIHLPNIFSRFFKIIEKTYEFYSLQIEF